VGGVHEDGDWSIRKNDDVEEGKSGHANIKGPSLHAEQHGVKLPFSRFGLSSGV